jgi:hypothetical protein
VFPNPVNDQTQVSFYNKENAPVEISLIGLDGRYYKELFIQELSAGHQSIQLELHEKTGIYFLKITNSTSTAYHKIFIQ